MSMLEIAAVVASALGVWLTTRRLLISWPITLVACALYAEVFREAKLYSDMLLQGVFAVFAIYGWWHWHRGVEEEGAVRVANLSARGWLLGLAAGAAGCFALGAFMAHYTDAALPYVDAGLTSYSLVATLWATHKYIANWTLWIVVDVIYTGVFVYKHLYLTAALYAFFVLLAVMGLQSWRKALGEQRREGFGTSGDPQAESNLA
jgi:nicotinamide mononucleotide transporter